MRTSVSHVSDTTHDVQNHRSIEEVIKSGKKHGATREDLYGCLYFHVSDQLRSFADRLSRFNISIKVFCVDTIDLSNSIKRGHLVDFGVPSTILFDRIDVSNVVDAEYLGVSRVVDAWGGFLKRRTDATMVGYFMNWPARQEGAEPGSPHSRDIVEKLIAEERVMFYYDLLFLLVRSVV